MSVIFKLGNTTNNLVFTQKVDTFSQLVNGTDVGELSLVRNSTGIKFINFRDSGIYVWDGTQWKSDDNELIESVSLNGDEIDTLQSKAIDNQVIVKTPNDFPIPVDPTKIYKIDGKIDMGSNSIVVGAGGFYYEGLDYFVSSLYSNVDNYTMFINESGQPAGNIRGRNVEHYVSGVNSKIFNLDNQQNFAAVEFISCNFGRFASETPSLGGLSNYRQFRLSDVGIFRITDGLEFNGVWSGGFRITDSILLSIPANTTVFKEGNSLIFNGSSFSDINAVGVDDTADIFNFTENNFNIDEGFILDGARFNINSTPIPNINFSSTKVLFRGRGVKNTFPGGRWQITTQQVTPLSGNVLTKALGTTTYDDLVHFSQVNDNEFIYDSTIKKEFVVTGQIVVDGGANDVIDIVIRKWDNSASQYINVRTFTRNISNLLGGLDIAYFDPYAPVELNLNDRIEIWIRNTTDDTNATILEGSFLAINVRN